MKIDYWQAFYENAYYHVYNRANAHDLLFHNHKNYQFFLEKWQLYFKDYLDTYAYCLIPNHFHFIVKVKTIDDAFRAAVEKENTVAARKYLAKRCTLDVFLEDQFKRFFTSYAKSFNKQYKRDGSLFQKRFKRIQLRTHEQLLDKIAYVHHNPLHHNMSPFYETWTYSSYPTYLSILPTKLKRQEGLCLFDPLEGRIEVFVAFHEDYHLRWLKSRTNFMFDDSKDDEMFPDLL